MQFEIAGEELLLALKHIAGSVTGFDTRPNFHKFLFYCADKIPTLYAFGGDYGAVAKLPIALKGNSTVRLALPFNELFEFSKKFQGFKFKISLSEDKFDISVDGTSYSASIRSSDPEAFPAQPKLASEGELPSVSASSLLSAIRFALPASKDDDSRPEMSGLDINSKRIVSSDGRICFYQTLASGFPDIALTTASAKELARVLSACSPESVVRSYISGGMAVFVFDSGSVFYTKLRIHSVSSKIDMAVAKFFGENKNTLRISKLQLLDSLAVVRMATFPEDRRATLRLLKSKTDIHAQSRDGSTASVEIKSEWDGQSSFELVLNMDFLSTVLRDFSGKAENKLSDMLELRISDNPKSPLYLAEGDKIGIIQTSVLKVAAVKAVVDASSETVPK